MTVTCSTCTRFTMGEHPGTTDEKSKRSAARMARMGMGRCLVGDHFRFLNPDREHSCARYQDRSINKGDRNVSSAL